MINSFAGVACSRIGNSHVITGLSTGFQMPRPKRSRKVCCLPVNTQFAPLGFRSGGDPVVLGVDEYETIRLIDLEGMTQQECAEKMNIVRTSVQATYASARKKLADLIVNGRLLIIEGGDYRLCEGGSHCGRGCRRFANAGQPAADANL